MRRSSSISTAVIIIASLIFLSGCSGGRGKAESFDPATDYQYQFYQPDATLGADMTMDEEGCLYYPAGSYIYKYDPRTGSNKPLCNKANCLHDKEKDVFRQDSCNAYFPYANADLHDESLIAYEKGYIYLAQISDMASDDGTVLTRIKTDGSERKEIHTTERNNLNHIFHRGYYFYTDQSYDKNNKAKFAVMSYPLDGNGKEKKIFVPKSKWTYEINGYTAYGDYLFFQVSETNSKGSVSVYRYYRYNISTGECDEVRVEDGSSINSITFYNGKLIYYTVNEKELSKCKTLMSADKKTFHVPVYMSDPDGSNIKRIKLNVYAGDEIYSDGKYLVVSNDNHLSVSVAKEDDPAIEKAYYDVYDKDFRRIGRYTEGVKGYNDEYKQYRVYYGPLGMGDISYFVKRDAENGTAVLYGGEKSQIRGLNGKQFKRKKLAVIKRSPAMSEYPNVSGSFKKVNGRNIRIS
ncbi:MAG: hypothetical protein SPL57_00075 [Lachnospiraceae bacterium]|nr:hypothetical protein [Lachnospiraceae bacterium]